MRKAGAGVRAWRSLGPKDLQLARVELENARDRFCPGYPFVGWFSYLPKTLKMGDCLTFMVGDSPISYG